MKSLVQVQVAIFQIDRFFSTIHIPDSGITRKRVTMTPLLYSCPYILLHHISTMTCCRPNKVLASIHQFTV